ncbi:MAG: type III pantothenate kinase [Phycisphaerae bacterium]
MIAQNARTVSNRAIAVIDIGNTSIALGRWDAGRVADRAAVPTTDGAAFDVGYAELSATFRRGRPAAVAVASVVPAALAHVRAVVNDALDKDPLVVGDRLPLPMDVGVTDPKAIGTDRVCAAAAAYDQLQGACAVVDIGTAVTLDIVDDDGTLLGGAILPGLRLQLRALHEHTAQLPDVPPDMPQHPYGRNTREAIQAGVCGGLVGTIRGLVEAYASRLNKWPHVVATGGDVAMLRERLDFVDSVVPDLTLLGIGLAYARYLGAQGA